MITPARIFDAGELTRDELRQVGRNLRSVAARKTHGRWVPPADRVDPIDILGRQDAARVPELVPIRYGRMLASPFAFLRGSAAVMAADLAHTPTTGVNVQVCGDAHVANFGVYATPERHLVFDVNDFDETIAAPWEYDVKRLAVSIILDARDAGWGDRVGRNAVREAIGRYRTILGHLAHLTTLDVHYAHMDEARFFSEHTDENVVWHARRLLERARHRTGTQAVHKLTHVVDGAHRFTENPPLIARPRPETVERFATMFDRYRTTLRDDRRHVLREYRFRDVVRKVVGVGSVGLEAYVMLLQGRTRDDVLALQVKEATTPVFEAFVGPSGFVRQGERVVTGQWRMQSASDPFLGWAPFADIDVYVRQLRDNKGPSDRATDSSLYTVECALIGGTLARAHARSVDPALLRGYIGRNDTFAEALVSFAVTYADQVEADHQKLAAAAADGRVPVERGI